jgi:hypothetical protein
MLGRLLDPASRGQPCELTLQVFCKPSLIFSAPKVFTDLFY